MKLSIQNSWRGEPAPELEHVTLELEVDAAGLRLELDAPFFGDPPPPCAPGSTPRLWEHEVVELFLFAEDGRYLEIELGPHGHHLVLELDAPRVVRRHVAELDYDASITGARWRGRARVPRELVPPQVTHVNAHAIHGPAGARRHSSAGWHSGPRPDFHRKDAAIALDPGLAGALRR